MRKGFLFFIIFLLIIPGNAFSGDKNMSDEQFIKLTAQLLILNNCGGMGCGNAGMMALTLAAFTVPNNEDTKRILKNTSMSPEEFEAEYHKRMFKSGSERTNELLEKLAQEINKLAAQKK